MKTNVPAAPILRTAAVTTNASPLTRSSLLISNGRGLPVLGEPGARPSRAGYLSTVLVIDLPDGYPVPVSPIEIIGQRLHAAVKQEKCDDLR